jgi:hypothetical protein
MGSIRTENGTPCTHSPVRLLKQTKNGRLSHTDVDDRWEKTLISKASNFVKARVSETRVVKLARQPNSALCTDQRSNA